MLGIETTPDTLVTYSLEMRDPSQFPLDEGARADVQLVQLETPDVPFYRFLYNTVGEAWRWRDRRLMSDDELRAVMSAPGVDIFVLNADGAPAGYFENVTQDGDTEIAYLGLRPGFTGRGLGKYLLSAAIARAWAAGTRRVWVHTCNLDHPAALNNYLARGFNLYDTHEQPMPDRYRE